MEIKEALSAFEVYTPEKDEIPRPRKGFRGRELLPAPFTIYVKFPRLAEIFSPADLAESKYL
jgi:hypothetical protein